MKTTKWSTTASAPTNPPRSNARWPGGFLPLFIPYHYYYGGWGGYGIGSVVGGGSYAPSPGRSYTTRSGVTTRGGFGSSFSEGGSHSSGSSSSGHSSGGGT